jgi:hypothetical protein
MSHSSNLSLSPAALALATPDQRALFFDATLPLEYRLRLGAALEKQAALSALLDKALYQNSALKTRNAEMDREMDRAMGLTTAINIGVVNDGARQVLGSVIEVSHVR